MKPVIPSASSTAPNTAPRTTAGSSTNWVSMPMPIIPQVSTTMACTVLSTTVVETAWVPEWDHNVSTRALATSPPMVATGSRVLTAAPIHDASSVWVADGRWPAGNRRRQASAARTWSGRANRHTVTIAQPPWPSRWKTVSSPCQTTRMQSKARPMIRPMSDLAFMAGSKHQTGMTVLARRLLHLRGSAGRKTGHAAPEPRLREQRIRYEHRMWSNGGIAIPTRLDQTGCTSPEGLPPDSRSARFGALHR